MIVAHGETLQDWVADAIQELWSILHERSDRPREEAGLASWLYLHWYCGSPQERRGALTPQRLVARLRSAHAHTREFEPDWLIEEVRPDLGPGAIVAFREGVRKILTPVDYVVPESPFGPHSIGTPVWVSRRRDVVIEGTWRTWGAGWPANADQAGPLFRVYFSFDMGDMPAVAAAVTGVADDGTWMLKFAVEPQAEGRRDVCVLYARSQDLGHWRPLLASVNRSLQGLQARTTPPFSRPVAPGIAVAEDPVGPESFGEDRCARVAAVLAAGEGFHGVDELADALASAFAQDGLDLRQPDRRAKQRGDKS